MTENQVPFSDTSIDAGGRSRGVTGDSRLDHSAEDSRLADVRFGLLARYRWLAFILPLVVYHLFGYLEPRLAPESSGARAADSAARDSEVQGSLGSDSATFALRYPLMYTVRIAATVAAIIFVLPIYRQFPFRISPLSIAVGVVGVVVWVGICRLELEEKLLAPLGLGPLLGLGERAAFNPYQHLGHQAAVLTFFLAIRFLGLAAVVPLIEEFFLRGFLMRFVSHAQWWKLPIGAADTAAVITGTVYGMLSHPAELFAAAVWFSLITWLMIKTRNIWDCVAAHSVTNLLLGIYVLAWHHWLLW